MEWKRHDYWADKLYIDKDVSEFVNRLIDVVEGRKNLPPEFKNGLDAARAEVIRERDVAGSDSLAAAVTANNDGHDSARNLKSEAKLHADTQLRFMHKKGLDYVLAWYLHHHLDYLHENSGGDFQKLLGEYEQKYPQCYSQFVENFLRRHRNELISELNL